jgi:hypothetical protein
MYEALYLPNAVYANLKSCDPDPGSLPRIHDGVEHSPEIYQGIRSKSASLSAEVVTSRDKLPELLRREYDRPLTHACEFDSGEKGPRGTEWN